MSVHPIEFRYFYDEMKSVFTEEAKLRNWLNVEAALARAHAGLGHIPESAAKEISEKAGSGLVKLERVKEIESEIHHDLMAMVRGFTEVCSAEAGKFIHLGATSYDIEDTALAVQLLDALKIIKEDVTALKDTLADMADKHKRLVCIGRTHGQQAVPTTYGLKFAVFACEFDRHLDRLAGAADRIRVGKMTGAVGTQAGFGKDAAMLQKMVMDDLGLEPAQVSNQVVQRDRHAEVVFVLALIATTADKIAKELRNLQRTEIGEIYESFGGKQVGSSTMPHKRNPHKSERVCSLARIVRSHVAPAMENIPLEHERDLTNSASERIVFPESFILTDYMLRQLGEILSSIVIREDSIRRNLDFTGGLIMCEHLMVGMVEGGMGRQEAHEILRVAAGEVFAGRGRLKDILMKNESVMKVMSESELERRLDASSYIGTAVEQVEKAVACLKNKK